MACRALTFALAITLSPLAAGAAGTGAEKVAAVADQACLDCHSDSSLTTQKGHREVSLFADPAVIAKSSHASLKCVDCHDGFDPAAIPHKKAIGPVDCASCHEDLGARHAFHFRLGLSPIPAGTDTACTDCHGTHAVASAESPGFPFVRARQAEACGRCHQSARDEFAASAHGRAFGAADAPSCLVCHLKAIVSPVRGKADISVKLAQAVLCESCHVDKPAVANQALRGTHFVAAFDKSVHGAALHRGNAEAANCVDCHGAHEMNRAMAASARMGKLKAAETCAKCHASVASAYQSSVHAAALRRGSVDSPTCTDCHGEHDIRAHTDPSSPVYASNLARQVCATCHASVTLTKKYGLTSNTFQTFSDSYHGLAEREGSLTVANCASCHSAHAIKSALDPTSSVNKANLVRTCGQCHPGANTRFTFGSVHVSLSAPDGKDENTHILHLIANFYVILIVLVVGAMFLHNALDFLKKIRRKLAIQKGLVEEEHVAHRLYLRMTVQERLQHGTLVLSFMVLVVTGFMLHYPDAWWVDAIRRASSRLFELRGLVHRIAGAVMMAAAFWHIAYLAFTKPGRSLFRDLLPQARDLTDPFKVMKYNIGLSPDKPRFGRFSYMEKAEYWALVWGTMLMGITGAILWFENVSMGRLTKMGFDVSHTVHFYEAILATLAIIVWHFYFVIFNPDIYPVNLAWLTGRMSEREMQEEHPAELERLKAAEAKPAEPPPPAK